MRRNNANPKKMIQKKIVHEDGKKENKQKN